MFRTAFEADTTLNLGIAEGPGVGLDADKVPVPPGTFWFSDTGLDLEFY